MVTTGFSRSSDRQINIWNTGDLSKPVRKMDVDTSSGVLMPFFDSDVNVLYVAGKVFPLVRLNLIVFRGKRDRVSFLNRASETGI